MIIKSFLVTEKSTAQLTSNILHAIVDIGASKQDIKEEMEKRFGVEVVKVRVSITPQGEKKAYIKLSDEYSAEEILSSLGVY